jgi:hypothetical protein
MEENKYTSFVNVDNALKEEKLKLLQEQLSGNEKSSAAQHETDEIINPIVSDVIEPEIDANIPRIIVYKDKDNYKITKDYFNVQLVFDPKLNIDPISLLILDITQVSELLIFARVQINVNRWTTIELLCRNDKISVNKDDDRMYQISSSQLLLEVYQKYGRNKELKIFCFLQNMFG